MEQLFLSDLLQKKVLSASGEVLGKVWDLVVDLDLPEPEVMKLVFRRSLLSKRTACVPWTAVADLLPESINLSPDSDSPGEMEEEHSSEILLRDFLLDKQIVDIHGAKVERVNDLQFIRENGKLILVQVDVGVRGLLRRMGWEKSVVRFWEWFFDYTPKDRFIAWSFAQPLADPDRLKLEISQDRLASLHPADLADIIEDMDVNERAAVVESFSEEVLADALEEVDPRIQVSIIRSLEPDRAADIIEEMSPDEAADLLQDLPNETASGILEEMDDEYEEKVRGLLAHDEDEAGGLMSTQFIALPPNSTIVDALAYIKKNADEMDVIYYIYVVDDESKLLGIVNLRELLSNEIFTPLERIMAKRLITARPDDDAEDIADLFSKYGFRAIPVVDETDRMMGVVRFKALLEILAPHLGR